MVSITPRCELLGHLLFYKYYTLGLVINQKKEDSLIRWVNPYWMKVTIVMNYFWEIISIGIGMRISSINRAASFCIVGMK